MKLVPVLSGVALALFLAFSGGDASAAGAALDPSELPAKTRADLRAEIDKARLATPELFKQVEDVAVHANDLDAQARAPGLPLTMQLKPLGNRALYPMLELLAFDSHAKDLRPSAATALRLGLIEAIGTIRDPHAIPVFEKLVDSARENDTVRASAEGLARIGTDEAVNVLVTQATKHKLTDSGDDRERAILSGMHDCRREAAAKFLAKRLRQNPSEETTRVIAKSLGGVANAWAWKTLTNQSELGSTRGLASAALLETFVAFRADVRESAAKALLVVDDPNTPSMIAQAKKSASPEVLPALEQLEKRFANNPSR